MDKSAKERAKEAEMRTKEQQKEEKELKERVEKLKAMKERLVRMGGVKEAKEIIEREIEEEEEEEEEEEVEIEEHWREIATEFGVVLPEVKTQIPDPNNPQEPKRIKISKENKKERKKEELEAHNTADLVTISDQIYGRHPKDDFDEYDQEALMRLYDEIDQELERIEEYWSLEAHPTHTPQQCVAMSHDDQNMLFSEVRPCKRKAEAVMLKKRWEALIGPEVYQYWRSFGWRVPDGLEWGKILKLQDKKIRVNISANHAKGRDDHLLNQFVLVFHSLTLTFNKLVFLSLKLTITFKITCRRRYFDPSSVMPAQQIRK